MERHVQQYSSFRVIVTLLNDGRNGWPKHVVLNKRIHKYSWCRVVREVKTDINNGTFTWYAAVHFSIYQKRWTILRLSLTI